MACTCSLWVYLMLWVIIGPALCQPEHTSWKPLCVHVGNTGRRLLHRLFHSQIPVTETWAMLVGTVYPYFDLVKCIFWIATYIMPATNLYSQVNISMQNKGKIKALLYYWSHIDGSTVGKDSCEVLSSWMLSPCIISSDKVRWHTGRQPRDLPRASRQVTSVRESVSFLWTETDFAMDALKLVVCLMACATLGKLKLASKPTCIFPGP